ncbi:hypothetical protein HYALB_00005687 [Hymenoscyphus albidus]|uniref:Uncharacterized protein n=1 Tax=Hymenoscyphus albidus TaxID=595503 RepID=A0A9N9LLT1_9HELO|nr:hypothetical protein HYALB_00005687 [Hymenoscyphus albidus]
MADIATTDATTDADPASKATIQIESQAPSDERLLVKWLEKQSTSTQIILAEKKIQELLQQASQPRHASGKACLKLCYFVEQCTKSSSRSIQDVAFSKETSLGLFNFYVEWNEKSQARSMRQVLELISSLLAQNPNTEISSCVKAVIFQQTFPLITREAAHPLVKPSFKSLECLLGKGTVLPEELFSAYELYDSRNDATNPIEKDSELIIQSWDSFVSVVFYWLGPADVSAAAGKFLVTLLKPLRTNSGVNLSPSLDHSNLWQRWIRDGLAKNPHALENVKNYLFSPLFKLDRQGSLAFLQDLNQKKPISTILSGDIDSHALVQLAAIDAGKKAGLIQEPSSIRPEETKSKKLGESIILDEEAIDSLLANASDTIRSLAFSVLTSSFSSTRPFSPAVLDILRPNMGLLYADTDAKFRNEVLSNTKHLIERLRGATALLAREIEQCSFKISHGDPLNSALLAKEKTVLHATQELFSKHQKFLEWYVNFLLGELIPTSSYQRHIMALRAIHILLHSRLQGPGSALSSIPVPANSTKWPFSLQFFNARSMRLLLDLLMDPFEDVRSTAADILRLSDRINFMKVGPQDDKKSLQDLSNGGSFPTVEIMQDTKWVPPVCDQPSTLLTDFISKAEEASKRTGRADYADGVARSYKILYDLQISLDARLQLIDGLVKRVEQKVSMAEKDLALAVLEAPTHGDFAALSLVSNIADLSLDYQASAVDQSAQWEKWANLQLQMVSISSRIWEAVKEVLCNDSPEGNLPDGIEDVDMIDTKDVLSYSFRAVHGSSLLLNILSSNLKQHWPEAFSATIYETFNAIANLSFTQLSCLRHRGAFSTVANTFDACCKLSHSKVLQKYASIATDASLPTPALQVQTQLSPLDQLIDAWWQRALQAIDTQSSSTRRSAGLPALMTSIMSVMDLNSHLRQLVDKSREGATTEASRVHLLNSIREAFKNPSCNSRLEPNVIVDCFKLAAENFTSTAYPLRNCGLLLFQALANHLLGAENKFEAERGWSGEDSKVSFAKYPGLLEVLLGGLHVFWSGNPQQVDQQATQGLFPVLDVIRRGGVPREHLHRFKQLILTHMQSNEWHVREISAKAFVALTPRADWQLAIQELFARRNRSTDISNNKEHGVLLAIELVLRRELESTNMFTPDEDYDYVKQANAIFRRYYHELPKSECPSVRQKELEAGNLILQLLILRTRMNKGKDQDGKLWIPSDLKVLDEDLDSMPDYNDPDIAIRGVYLAYLRGNVHELKRVMAHFYQSSEASALTALDVTSSIWAANYERDWLDLLSIYKAVLNWDDNNGCWCFNAANSAAVQARALRNINDLLDGRSSTTFSRKTLREDPRACEYLKEVTGYLTLLSNIITHIYWVPDLVNQYSILKGHLLGAQILSGGLSGQERSLMAFANAADSNLSQNNAVDTRYAWTVALRNVVKWDVYHGLIDGDETLLPILIVIYKALNDDDDGVRSLAASAVEELTEQHITPLGAADILLQYIGKHYSRSSTFAHNILEHVTGRGLLILPRQAGREFDLASHFRKSMMPDNSLFVEERQNLWVDPVRECRRWYDQWRALSVNSDRVILGRLVKFATSGFQVMTDQLLLEGDGPHGWTFKYDVFSICISIITSANIVLTACNENRHEGHITEEQRTNMMSAMQEFVEQADKSSLHPEIFYQLLGPEAIATNKLDELMPWPFGRLLGEHVYLRGPNVYSSHSATKPPPHRIT